MGRGSSVEDSAKLLEGNYHGDSARQSELRIIMRRADCRAITPEEVKRGASSSTLESVESLVSNLQPELAKHSESIAYESLHSFTSTVAYMRPLFY